MTGKTCVITGATSGIGRAAALRLGGMGADLVLTGRNEREAARLLRRIGRAGGPGRAVFVKADLSSQREVRRLAADIGDRCERIDILINNAGARFDSFQRTADNVERTFATNHLAHFLLTVLLLDKVLRAKAARVITVSSGAHGGGTCDFERILREENYDRKVAYATSKLANLMFSFELARRLEGTAITSNAMDPGGVATNLGRNNGLTAWMRHLGYYLLKRELISADKGAETIVYLATSPDVEGTSGKYYYRNRETSSSAGSRDEGAARKLWALSAGLTGVDDSIGPAWAYVRP